jgi:hypothetical protein
MSTFWAHYENNVYREIHLWSELLKDTYDLYRYTRSIFSPAYRSIEFWATHILGGSLDPLAGDGVSRPQRVADRDRERGDPGADRAGLARQQLAGEEGDLGRFGAAMGDSAVMVVDDPVKQKVQFKVVDPRTLRDVSRDNFGNVVGTSSRSSGPTPSRGR